MALLHGGHSATRWLALQPIALALLAVAAASLRDATGLVLPENDESVSAL